MPRVDRYQVHSGDEWTPMEETLRALDDLVCWRPLAAGFLTGKQRRGQSAPEGSRRAALGDTGATDLEQGFDIIDVLDEIARTRSVSIAQVAINWLLRRPGITSVIIGARTQEQLAAPCLR